MIKAKRITAFLMVMIVMVMALAGCGNSSEPSVSDSTDVSSTDNAETVENAADTDNNDSANASVQEPETEENTSSQSESRSDTLVVYFSRTGEQYTVGVIDKGNTAIVAEMIAEQTGADMFEILPVDDHYPMTYSELTDVAKQEQNDNARPAYAGEVPDLSQYSTIFIGAPVWWGDWPMIMYTFFENNQEALAGKILYPFSTHEGSGLSGFNRKLSSACPDSTVGDGLAIRGNDCQNKQNDVRESVNGWLSGLEY